MYMNTPAKLIGKDSESFFMRTQTVQDQMNRSLAPARKHVFFPESATGLCIFMGCAATNRGSCCGTKCPEPLQGPVPTITVRPTPRPLPPASAATRDRLKGTEFIKADNDPPSRRMAVEFYDGVFFPSKSGSRLSHQVCPVKNRRPWRDRVRRMVSRLRDFRGRC